jgi:hypothetical protein
MRPLRAVALFLALARLGFLARAVRASTNVSKVPSEGCSLTNARAGEAPQLIRGQLGGAQIQRGGMRGLATWSGRMVLGLWLAWFGLLVGFVALSVRRQWRSQVAAPVFALSDSTARPSADSAPTTVSGKKGLQSPPEQHTDVIYSVVGDEVDLLKTSLVLFGPPGLLTVLWLYARHRRGPFGKRH